MSHISPHLITREAIQTWLLDFHKSTATLDAKYCTDKFFATDIELQYANNPVVSGRDTATGFFDVAFKALDLMEHDIEYFDFVGPNRLYQACTIRYVVKGDHPEKDMFKIPAFLSGVLAEEHGKLKFRRSEIYLDASTLFGRMAEKGLLPS